MAPRHVTEFVEQLTPMAVEIGARYGIDPALIITQAAIESGWGSSVSGNNYFGVKSHGQPGGQTITTHEEIDGKRVKVRDSFRVYDSLAGSMEDYANFLSTNPRYGGVFKSRNLDDQVEAIASSGYATDSKYPGLLRDVSRMVKREMPPIPPADIPNVVASQLDTTPQTRNVPRPQPRPDQRMIQGSSERPTSAASRAFPVIDATPRLAPAQDGIFAYNPTDMKPAHIAGGVGSATPDFFQPQVRLPGLQPSNIGTTRNVAFPRIDPRVPNRMDLASLIPNNVMRQELQLQGQSYAGQDRARPLQAPGMSSDQMVMASMDRANAAVDPGLLRALAMQQSGIGQPPTTRVVPSVQVSGFPGPSAPPKTQERLAANVYPAAPMGGSVATALAVTPRATGFPTPVQQRPVAVFGFPTANTFRPTGMMTQPLRVTVNGGNYVQPQTFQGSNTGRTYTAGQRLALGNDVVRANADGSFTNERTGRKTASGTGWQALHGLS